MTDPRYMPKPNSPLARAYAAEGIEVRTYNSIELQRELEALEEPAKSQRKNYYNHLFSNLYHGLYTTHFKEEECRDFVFEGMVEPSNCPPRCLTIIGNNLDDAENANIYGFSLGIYMPESGTGLAWYICKDFNKTFESPEASRPLGIDIRPLLAGRNDGFLTLAQETNSEFRQCVWESENPDPLVQKALRPENESEEDFAKALEGMQKRIKALFGGRAATIIPIVYRLPSPDGNGHQDSHLLFHYPPTGRTPPETNPELCDMVQSYLHDLYKNYYHIPEPEKDERYQYMIQQLNALREGTVLDDAQARIVETISKIQEMGGFPPENLILNTDIQTVIRSSRPSPRKEVA